MPRSKRNQIAVRKNMQQACRDWPLQQSGQTWTTLLRNHASEIWACDFVQTYDVFFRTIFVFFIIELESRRVIHFGITRSPRDSWIAQQRRNATSFEEGPRFLICDNDKKFGAHISRVTDSIQVLKTPVRAPKANAVASASWAVSDASVSITSLSSMCVNCDV